MSFSPTTCLTIPMALILCGLFLAAAFYDWISFRRRKRKKKTIYRCRSCRNIYTDSHRTPLSRCPKCNEANKLIR